MQNSEEYLMDIEQNCFELLGCVAVATNCALLCLSPKLRMLAPSLSPVEYVLLFVLAEHVILMTKASLMYILPDQPMWVREALEKVAFQSKLALKNEVRNSPCMTTITIV